MTLHLLLELLEDKQHFAEGQTVIFPNFQIIFGILESLILLMN